MKKPDFCAILLILVLFTYQKVNASKVGQFDGGFGDRGIDFVSGERGVDLDGQIQDKREKARKVRRVDNWASQKNLQKGGGDNI